MQIAEFIVVLILILVFYRPMLWVAKKLVLRTVKMWSDLDKGVVPVEVPADEKKKEKRNHGRP